VVAATGYSKVAGRPTKSTSALPDDEPSTTPATATTTSAGESSGSRRLAAIELRRRLNTLNAGIRELAHERAFLLPDLERLFHGHGLASDEPWYVQVIEPNLAGAAAIGEHWYELLNVAPERQKRETAA
jgi:hypothetical protein